jgi:RimJ/RimL family protein N-acetyltransferase
MPEAFVIRPMTAEDAHAIATWRYPDPYSFYEWDRDPDDLAELLDPAEWGRRYFSADDGHGELAGFFVIKPADGVAEIGLGLRPALTGRGLGAAFLDAGMRFAAARFGCAASRWRSLPSTAARSRCTSARGFARSAATSTRRTAPSTSSSG